VGDKEERGKRGTAGRRPKRWEKRGLVIILKKVKREGREGVEKSEKAGEEGRNGTHHSPTN
jgi:hypothetical protein